MLNWLRRRRRSSPAPDASTKPLPTLDDDLAELRAALAQQGFPEELIRAQCDRLRAEVESRAAAQRQAESPPADPSANASSTAD